MIYTWLTSFEFQEYSESKDKEINEVLQKVRKVDPRWYVSEREIVKRGFFKKKIETFYTLYENTGDTEVRYQTSVVTKGDLMNFLFGLNTGYHFKQEIKSLKNKIDVRAKIKSRSKSIFHKRKVAL